MTNGCGSGFWFTILPDTTAAESTSLRLRRYACRTLEHHSGRPWLIGCWSDDEGSLAVIGGTRVALLGTSSLSRQQLTDRARQISSIADVESAADGVSGSFHLLASVSGYVHARGSVSLARRLYRASVGGVTVLADRSRTLAWLAGAEPDPVQLIARLGTHAPPYPLDRQSLFTGVDSVPPGTAALVEPDGTYRERRFWQPPEPELPFAEAASGLREALRDAVGARVRQPGQLWAADLSGGMDSTSICFLAAEAGAELALLTLHLQRHANEDVGYAREAAEQLSSRSVGHVVFGPDEPPPNFAEIDTHSHVSDDTYPAQRTLAQVRFVAARAAELGAARRFSGQGGDHLATLPPSYLHDMFPRRPIRALRRVSEHTARNRWSRTAALRTLLDRRSFAAGLRQRADILHYGHQPRLVQKLYWDTSPATVPSWATETAREQYSARLYDLADRTEPMAARRGTHTHLWLGQQAGRSAAVYDHYRMSMEMPLCDDGVIEAFLRARPYEAASPRAYKPLLAAAMRGIVPDRVLDRTTKDQANANWYRGMKAHRKRLASWVEESRLTARGLVDPDGLRFAFLQPDMLPAREAATVEATLGVEALLRDLDHHPRPDYLREHVTDRQHATDRST